VDGDSRSLIYLQFTEPHFTFRVRKTNGVEVIPKTDQRLSNKNQS